MKAWKQHVKLMTVYFLVCHRLSGACIRELAWKKEKQLFEAISSFSHPFSWVSALLSLHLILTTDTPKPPTEDHFVMPDEFELQSRVKRSEITSSKEGGLNVETLVVADRKMLEKHGRDNVTTYVLTVMNMVSRAISSIVVEKTPCCSIWLFTSTFASTYSNVQSVFLLNRSPVYSKMELLEMISTLLWLASSYLRKIR